MELLLALAVIAAVIIFGALISFGNERQRRAIDELREQVVLWAIQDMRIKREHLAREVRVDDPIGWFNQIATKISGMNFNLQLVDANGELGALIFAAEGGGVRVVFADISPDEIRRLKHEANGRLSKYANNNPLFSLSSHATAYEISVLNGGVFFDLELPKAWKALTGKTLNSIECIWMYVQKGDGVSTQASHR
jgi:hypothetical protein